MIVERIEEVNDELVAAVARLVPQLSAAAAHLAGRSWRHSWPSLARACSSARDDGDVVGMLTLLVYRLVTGVRGRIEGVVVEEGARGRGVGEALTRAALDLAASAGVESVELTSSPSRAAANRLYPRLGFRERETNVYVWRPGG